MHRSRKGNFICVIFLLFSYTLILTYVLGAQKNRLIETVLLSTRNICFGLKSNLPVELVKEKGLLPGLNEKYKIIFQYTLLSGGLNMDRKYWR